MSLPPATSFPAARAAAGIGIAAAAAAMVLLRVIALPSDPYAGLDWSTGLLTDEGFYIHNARNVALFGRASTDGFNNMFLSPLLHLVQVAVFRAAGVGAVQARSISVGCGLAAVAVLYAALRRAFDARTALLGCLFLGLDHVFALFNRMALMDTPAALLAVCSFYAFVRACDERAPAQSMWMAVCGAFLGAAVVTRGLCLYLVAAPAAGIWALGSGAPRKAMLAAAGALLVPAWYLAFWYLPHAAEVRHMNSYYMRHQILPGSLHHLGQNLYHGFLGDRRGVLPYLFRHTPVLLALAAAGVAAAFRPPAAGSSERARLQTAALRFLAAWLAAGIGILAAASYSPGRYTVALWPPLCALAAAAVLSPAAGQRLREWRGAAPAAALAGLTWLFIYHADEALLGRQGLVFQALLYLIPTAAAFGISVWKARTPAGPALPKWLVPGVLGLWIALNGAWIADWAGHIRYAQRDLSLWLGAHVPASAAVLGDVAPGLCMDNRLKAVSVIPGLCNDAAPVARFGSQGSVVAVLDGARLEPWWKRHYPRIVHPARRMRIARVIKWDVGVYPILEGRIP